LFCNTLQGYTYAWLVDRQRNQTRIRMQVMAHRIVVFNHSSNILLLIESVLKQKGFDVFTFLEALTDVSRVTELSPDLVIIGHVKGFVDEELEIIYEFRANPATMQVPIIVCTTGAAQLRQSGGLEGVTYVSIVPKPFNVRELLDAVYLALGIPSPIPDTDNGSTSPSDSPIII
jgi:DNA-binding response OmpR family regulator